MNIYQGKLITPADYQLFMKMALLNSGRSVAERRQVGAIITDQCGRILGNGYNHMPHAMLETCCEIDGGKASNPLVVHAEKDAIRNTTERDMLPCATIFVTDAPCLSCAEEILSAGIRNVVYSRDYRLTTGLELLLEHNIQVFRVGSHGEVFKVTGIDPSTNTPYGNIVWEDEQDMTYLKHKLTEAIAPALKSDHVHCTYHRFDPSGESQCYQIQNAYDEEIYVLIEDVDRTVVMSSGKMVWAGCPAGLPHRIEGIIKKELKVEKL